MEGKEEWEGRLEVCYNKRWGTVSGDQWTLTNSHVVCNALGYNITSKSFLQLQRYLYLTSCPIELSTMFCYELLVAIMFCLLSLPTDEVADQSTPGAPSKPLYYHDVRCSERDMTLLDCGFTVYTGLTMTHSHAIVKCKQRKTYKKHFLKCI